MVTSSHCRTGRRRAVLIDFTCIVSSSLAGSALVAFSCRPSLSYCPHGQYSFTFNCTRRAGLCGAGSPGTFCLRLFSRSHVPRCPLSLLACSCLRCYASQQAACKGQASQFCDRKQVATIRAAPDRPPGCSPLLLSDRVCLREPCASPWLILHLSPCPTRLARARLRAPAWICTIRDDHNLRIHLSVFRRPLHRRYSLPPSFMLIRGRFRTSTEAIPASC